jgi:ABC-type siderophore export system fused ATPase/permease subunit
MTFFGILTFGLEAYDSYIRSKILTVIFTIIVITVAAYVIISESKKRRIEDNNLRRQEEIDLLQQQELEHRMLLKKQEIQHQEAIQTASQAISSARETCNVKWVLKAGMHCFSPKK